MPDTHTEKVKRLGEAPVFKLLCSFSVPCIFSMVISAIYMNVDAIFIAKFLGTDGLSALSVFAPIDIIALLFPSLSMAYGASTYISPALGQKQFRIANYYTTVFICMGLIYWGLAMLILLPLLPNILSMFNATNNVFRYARQYGIVAIPGYTITYMFSNSMGPILRAENRANLSMWRQLLGAVLNIALDAIFFYCVPKMEYYAASASTCISLLIVSIWMVLNIFDLIKGGVLRCKFGLLRYSVDELRDHDEQQLQSSSETPTEAIELENVKSTIEMVHADMEDGMTFETITGEPSCPPHVTVAGSPQTTTKRSSLGMIIYRFLAISFPFYINGVSGSVCSLLAAYYTTIISQANQEINRSAVGIVTRVTTLVSMPIIGLVQALTPILGYNLGAKKLDRVYLVLVYTSLIGVVMTLAIWGLCEGLAYPLMYLFAGDGETERAISALAVRLGLAGLPLQLFVSITVSVSQMKRRTVLSTILQFARAAVTIVCIFVLPLIIKTTKSRIDPVNGIFISPAVGDAVSGLVSMIIYIKWTLDYKKQRGTISDK
ncbi:Na+ driven multidrug efflux pump [Giardia lamblia P15]|uniref:Na+ driven multidrug efflux pump n=2 Tax=Giardia intestinalis (strain P15) TaxID=658858 RepID=E1EZ90_GIAIA|nr:Na+ driven multidrug efflux pump [Giardia lamblia P15]